MNWGGGGGVEYQRGFEAVIATYSLIGHNYRNASRYYSKSK